jgi:DNA-directed RNA polymerase specialized sigma24 family protein
MTKLHPIMYDLIPSVASTIYRKYKSYVELIDVTQECYSWAYSRTEYCNEMLSVEDVEERVHNEHKVAWQMRRVAERYARKEKATKSGYQIADEAYYESTTIAQLLPFVIASVIDGTVLEQAQEMLNDGQPRGSSSPAEGGNLLATLLDIKKNYLKLEVEDQDILRMRYHESFKLAQIAQVLECAISTADRRCTTALRHLIDKLGGNSPFR